MRPHLSYARFVASGITICRYIIRQLRRKTCSRRVVLDKPILYYPILSYPILSYTILYYTILYYTILLLLAPPDHHQRAREGAPRAGGRRRLRDLTLTVTPDSYLTLTLLLLLLLLLLLASGAFDTPGLP